MRKFLSFIQKNKFLILILFLALILRLSLVNAGFHDDLYSNIAWGQWIFEHGSQNFYNNEVWIYSWPTQPPLVNLAYAFDYWLYIRLVGRLDDINSSLTSLNLPSINSFYLFFKDASYQSTLKIGALITLKFFPILSDLIIALVLYIVAKKNLVNKKISLLFPTLYLFLPFSWYLSSIWGQYDQIGFLFLLLSFISLNNRRFVLSTLFIFLSFEIKPTSLVYIPLFILIFIRLKPAIKSYIFSAATLILAFFITLLPFNDGNLYKLATETLIQKIFYKSEFRVSTNAFNFWRIFIGNAAVLQDASFSGLTYKIYSYILFLPLFVFSLFISYRPTLRKTFLSIFILGFASYLFLTNMLDRYLFTGLMGLLFSSIFIPRLIIPFILASIIFSLNLYHQWWFPSQFETLKIILTYQNALVTKILSGLLVLIYFFCLYIIYKQKAWK